MSIKKTVITTASAASIAIATPMIASLEGYQAEPYRDIGGVWTYCFGETENVEFGKVYSEGECMSKLNQRVPDYYHSAKKHMTREVPITMMAAIISFNYNIGEGNFKKSTMLKLINQGKNWEACQELDRWVYVARMYVQGLANRRKIEKRLCVAELRGDI